MIPQSLKERPHWVCWRYEIRDGKRTKVPYQPSGAKAESDNRATWSDFEAVQAVAARFSGIGIMCADGLAGLDLDHCIENGEFTEKAQDFIGRMNTYTEVTPSGEGVRCLFFGELPAKGRKKGDIEIYNKGRFFTVTGNHVDGTPETLEYREAEIMAIHAEVFGASKKNGNGNAPHLPEAESYTAVLASTDDALIQMIEAGINDEVLTRLWRGNTQDYPSASEAELAFCSKLVGWGAGRERIDRMYRASRLFRPKWDEVHYGDGQTYGQHTLDVALEHRETDALPPDDAEHPRFKVYTAKDALEPQPPIEWVIEKLLTPGSVSALAGNPGSKKTYSLLDAAVCVALGVPWVGLATKGGPVLIVDEESGKRRLARRLSAVLAGHEAGETTPLFYTSLERLNLRLKVEEIALENLIVELSARLVIIDALVDVMPGGDENSVKDIQPVFAALRSMAEHTQAAIVIIHHFGKAGNYRGSSAISGAVDLMLNIESQHDSAIVNFSFEKARDAEPFKFSATANFDPGKFWLDARETQTSGLKLGKAQRYVLRYLNTHGASTVEDIMAGADTCAPNGARQAVYALADMSLVQRTNAGDKVDAVYELTIKGKMVAG